MGNKRENRRSNPTMKAVAAGAFVAAALGPLFATAQSSNKTLSRMPASMSVTVRPSNSTTAVPSGRDSAIGDLQERVRGPTQPVYAPGEARPVVLPGTSPTATPPPTPTPTGTAAQPAQQQQPPQMPAPPGGGGGGQNGPLKNEASDPGQWGPSAPSQSCKPTSHCQGNGVTVDLEAQCMCIDKGAKCFKVGIGSTGPRMTSSGIGILKGCQGSIYQSKAVPTTGYDNDCLQMGIAANDRYGKWLHKPANCMDAASYRTKGCIAVPCDMWPQVKAQAGNQITVCGGSGVEARGPATSSPGNTRPGNH